MMQITSTQITAALELAIKAQTAISEFLTNGLPTLQQAGIIIRHMQETGAEIPTPEEIQALRSEGDRLDAAAQAAIDAKRAEGG
jgi:hypothetical protein